MNLNKLALVASVLFASALSGQAMAQACTPKVSADHLITAGKMQMSINPTLPPQQFVDDKGELQGLNVELGREVAKRLCLEPVFVRMDMPPMVPALQAGRFDLINTGMFWTEERSKIMFQVPYGQQAMSIYTVPTSTFKITKFEDLAGHTVGIETGTYQERKSREFNAQMVEKGMKTIDFRTFTTASETTAALRAGQLEAAINADEVALSYADRGIVKIAVSGLYGTDITLSLRDKMLATATTEALTSMKADGSYDKLFDKFRMTRLKDVNTFVIRGPGPAAK
ncbi:MAG: putative transporter, amino acid-binding protein [Rhizobacter sp.]|nr:putative transporter, amino acid-binding protein [Rhizobacter sp.]